MDFYFPKAMTPIDPAGGELQDKINNLVKGGKILS